MIPAVEKIDNDHPIDYVSDNIEASLSHRDCAYRDLVLDKLAKNLSDHVTAVRYKKAENKPVELVVDATKAIEAINPNHKNFSTPEVLNKVEGLIGKLMGLVKKKSPENTLSIILNLLNGLEADPKTSDTVSLQAQLKEIQKIAYQKSKDIGA
ncbi:MAG TPA: hypothetical protein VG347_18895 [Verrucomicrobiae bacterium]|nr:hypothetical protein [Verrucomicrobiae bacterium]